MDDSEIETYLVSKNGEIDKESLKKLDEKIVNNLNDNFSKFTKHFLDSKTSEKINGELSDFIQSSNPIETVINDVKSITNYAGDVKQTAANTPTANTEKTENEFAQGKVEPLKKNRLKV